MSQNDYIIANQTAPAFRADLNDALQALASLSSGTSQPATTYANMLWYDTTNNILKMRTEADDAWMNIGYLDQTANAFRILDNTQVVNTSGTQTGLLGDQATSVWETGTSTTESLVSPAKVKAVIDAFSSGIGDGQTWQNVTSSRSEGATYTNTTGKPIMVNIRGGTAGNTYFSITATVGGTSFIIAEDQTSSVARPVGNFIVPIGSTYRVDTNFNVFSQWFELR
jgi:hypothetical protein